VLGHGFIGMHARRISVYRVPAKPRHGLPIENPVISSPVICLHPSTDRPFQNQHRDLRRDDNLYEHRPSAHGRASRNLLNATHDVQPRQDLQTASETISTSFSVWHCLKLLWSRISNRSGYWEELIRTEPHFQWWSMYTHRMCTRT
jgi:hypothetical protein